MQMRSFLARACAFLASTVVAAGAAVAPYTFQALVVPLSICNYPPSVTSSTLDATLFGSLDYSVENMFTGCSLGHAKFSRSDVTVLPFAVHVPCAGSVTDPNVVCDFDQWSQVADQWLAANYYYHRNFTQDTYVHRIYVLPRGIRTCAWAGMGWVGCKDSPGKCKVWIMGEAADQAMTYVHELGHNLGLNHANTPATIYGDGSDAMGFCCSVRCFNAANLDALGWAQPTIQLDVASLPQNQWLSFQLAVSTVSNANYIKITSPLEIVYAQYRIKQGFDQGIPATGVYMYTMPVHSAAAVGFSSPTQYGWLESARQIFSAGSGAHIKLAQDLSQQQQQALLAAGSGSSASTTTTTAGTLITSTDAMLLICVGMCAHTMSQ